jgi:hypothetical protein
LEFGGDSPAKASDLVVPFANPFDDIHNTLKLHYVVKNGRFYNPFTDELLKQQNSGTRHANETGCSAAEWAGLCQGPEK